MIPLGLGEDEKSWYYQSTKARAESGRGARAIVEASWWDLGPQRAGLLEGNGVIKFLPKMCEEVRRVKSNSLASPSSAFYHPECLPTSQIFLEARGQGCLEIAVAFDKSSTG